MPEIYIEFQKNFDSPFFLLGKYNDYDLAVSQYNDYILLFTNKKCLGNLSITDNNINTTAWLYHTHKVR